MGNFIAEDVLETIRLQVNIVELVSEYVRLEKKGKDYVGLCLFHQEKTPSFTVSERKQIFHCFGCGVGGNVFKFIMLTEGLSFPEAVRQLAARAGVFIPVTERADEQKRAKTRERAWEINAIARDFYRRILTSRADGSAAREYLLKRGLDEKIQEQFQLGYAPDNWTALVDYLLGQGCLSAETVDLGLAAVDDHGRVYDQFRRRIMFPICNPQGKVIGFGGRVLGDALPKYLNTKETNVFSKGHVLYGLDLARTAIREKGFAIIMEGYMDVITAHQSGIKSTVASLGTSLTEEQCRLLLRYTKDVMIAYDTDAAGVAAALRSLDLLQELDCRVRVVTIPQGKDPDEYLRRHGGEGWEALLKQAEPLLEYKIRQASRATSDVKEILQRVIPNVAGMVSPLEQEEGIKTIVSRLNLSWEVVKSELKRFRLDRRKKWPIPDKIAKNTHNIIQSRLNAKGIAEQEIVSLILQNPGYLPVVKRDLGEEFLEDPVLKKIFLLICKNEKYNPAAWMNQLDDHEQAILSCLMMERPVQNDVLSPLQDLIATMKVYDRKARKVHLLQELAQAERVHDYRQETCLLEELQQLLEIDRKNSARSGEGERAV
jgi:DNA primase